MSDPFAPDQPKEEEHDPQFEPVLKLTEQVETKTHEEDEDVRFNMRAKLFRFEVQSSEWKERGTGNVRLLAHKETKKIRLVMRREKTLKVCANHIITKDMHLQPNIGSDRSWVWKVAADFAEGEPSAETLAIRFANSENAQQFKDAFEEAQKSNSELVDTPAAPVATPAAEATVTEEKKSDEPEKPAEAAAEPTKAEDTTGTDEKKDD